MLQNKYPNSSENRNFDGELKNIIYYLNKNQNLINIST